MPEYQYACRECGVVFETRQRMTDPPLSECPACSGEIYRMMQPVGISFVGPGFHKTDYPSRT